MTIRTGFEHDSPTRRACAVAACAALLLFGCRQAPHAEDSASAEPTEPAAKEPAEGVKLTPDQAARMGITAEAVQRFEYAPEAAGYGVVAAHEAIAAAVAELTTAQLTERQSQAALARSQRLEGTPGATSAELQDTALRQAATDSAAVSLAKQRLSAIIGSRPAWKPADSVATLRELADGRVRLVRATFPLGAYRGATPATLRAAPLDSPEADSAHPVKGWTLKSVWDAPADASLPGRSFFGLLEAGEAAEGERLLVWAPGTGPAQPGVRIPAAALVISDNKSWCYVEKSPGTFVRKEIDTAKPLADGYFVAEGIVPGDRVVTAAAGLLLAREINPSTEAD